ncbi:MAG TPA: hypothetical protein VFG21_05965 [Xanthomonadaceae bacterium]|nr:hypothetical protein [Xanthomonadaceae bacterium]
MTGLATGNSVVLQNNSGDDLTVNANGAFTFSTALADRSAYAVTVLTQPTTPNQTCTVAKQARLNCVTAGLPAAIRDWAKHQSTELPCGEGCRNAGVAVPDLWQLLTHFPRTSLPGRRRTPGDYHHTSNSCSAPRSARAGNRIEACAAVSRSSFMAGDRPGARNSIESSPAKARSAISRAVIRG